MEKTLTITVPEEFIADLEELAREEGLSEEEVILNALMRRVAGSRIRSLANPKPRQPKGRKRAPRSAAPDRVS